MRTPKRLLSPEVLRKRNKKMIELINDGVSIGKLSVLFGITRERIAQIYFKLEGKSVREFRLVEKLSNIKKKIKFPHLCIWCRKNKTYHKVFCNEKCALAFRTEVQRRTHMETKYQRVFQKNYKQLQDECIAEVAKING